MKRITYVGVVVLSLGLFALACGKDDGPEKPDPGPNPSPTTIELDKTSLNLYPFLFYKESLQVTTDIGSASVAWSSSNEDVATVNANGEVNPLSIGTATITATVGEATATCSVNVADGPVNELTLDAETLELYTFETGVLSIATLDAEVETTSTPVWHSNDETVATVDQEGNVTGKGTGTTEVSVTVDNMTIDATITVSPNVYVVGNSEDKAVLWINGTPSFLAMPDGYSYSYANDVFVAENGDVHVAGHAGVINNGIKYDAVLWTNGNANIIGNGIEESHAHSVKVFESNVYVAGNQINGAFSEATVWINGTPNLLENSDYDTYAYGLDVNDNGVYAVGVEKVNTLDRAKLWKLDGESILLAENNDDVNASGVTLYGTDIYVVGRVEENGVKLARRWKIDGGEVDLNENLNSNASTSDVVVDENVVYTVGAEVENGTNTAKLWVDETAIALSNDDSTYFYANSVKVDAKDKAVYVAGARNIDGPNWAARLWIKRGSDIETMDLSGTFQSSGASAVFIK